MSNDLPQRGVTESWESWVDFILESPNPHWSPQTEMLDGAANVLYRFETIKSHWYRLFGMPLFHENVSVPLPTSDYRYDDVREFYREDLRLWHELEDREKWH